MRRPGGFDRLVGASKPKLKYHVGLLEAKMAIPAISTSTSIIFNYLGSKTALD